MTISRCNSPVGMRAALVVSVLATSVGAQEVVVPSGIPMRLYEVILEEPTKIARFRLVSEAVDPQGDALEFLDLLDDLKFICSDIALPSLADKDWVGDEVVISIGDRETPFGVFNEDVTQFFQPYTISQGRCEWSDF